MKIELKKNSSWIKVATKKNKIRKQNLKKPKNKKR